MPGLCFDNDDVLEVAENFMKALVTRYRDHPGLGGYDVWNEQNTNGSSGGCYCDGSAVKFRAWLKEKYKDLDVLARAWHRYSYRDWNDIEIPRHGQFYGDEIDWQLFRIDNAYKIMQWRIDLIRGIDPDHPVTAHADTRKTIRDLGPGTYQAWRASAMVDGYGNSGGCNHEEWSKNSWAHWLISDTTRSASGGKPFWAAEVPGGYSWRLHGNHAMDRGRMATANDIRLHHMTHFAGGATGIFSPRWRPLLNGAFTGHFGFYDMDGSPNDRSEMVSVLAKWANHPEQEELWKARPVRGDMGMLVVPESQIQCYLLEGSTKHYYNSIAGAYQGFLFNNIQVDFVNFDRIGNCPFEVLYLPHPLMLPEKVVNDLIEFVRRGGVLISEGCPAYYGDHGRAGENQPNYGLDKVFGAMEERVRFTPVLLEGMKFNMGGRKVAGGVYLQSFIPAGGSIAGTFEDGTPAVIDHHFGSGKTRLIGTCPGYGFYEAEVDPGTREFFGDLLK